MNRHEGACHCGAVTVSFETALAPEEIEVRACQCSFCRRHGAKNVSDPQGRVAIEGGELIRYRFAAGLTEFLICARCGCYVAAVIEEGGDWFATLNVTGVAMEPFSSREAKPMVYDGEDVGGKLRRRRAKWSPAVLPASARAGESRHPVSFAAQEAFADRRGASPGPGLRRDELIGRSA